MTKKPLVGLLLVLALFAIWAFLRLPVYEGPCQVDQFVLAGSVFIPNDHLPVTCNGKPANASKTGAMNAMPPSFGEAEVPCKVYRDHSADCDFTAYRIVGKSKHIPRFVQ